MIMPLETNEDIRSLTAQALRDAEAGFAEFARRIDACCTAFEDGRDSSGREALAALTGPIGDFARFCNLVMANCGESLTATSLSRMTRANHKLEHALHAVVAEAEDDNPLGIGDACRFDLAEALEDYRTLFPTMAMELDRR
jgi:hypothetical protein